MKLKVHPGRVVVRRKETKLKGGIHLPPARNKLYEIGEVVLSGDNSSYGVEGKSSTKEVFNPGDLLLFQLPLSMAGMVTHEIKGVLHAFLHVEDIIARLSNDTIAIENFTIAGRFLLLNADMRAPSKIIITPQDVSEETKGEHLHFSVLQMGADVKLDLDKGQEVFPDKGRVNPISIDGKDYCFVDQQFIYGALE